MEYNIEDLVTEDKLKIKETKPVGRPKKEPTEKRSYKIMVNLTKSEYDQIVREANESSISAAVFVRMAALNASDTNA